MSTYRKFFQDRAMTDFCRFFDDFTKPIVAADWTTTVVGTGTHAVLTGSAAGSQHGLRSIINSAADDDSVASQVPVEAFKLVAGKKLAFRARFQIVDPTQSDFLLGLAVLDTTPFDATDGIFFKSDDGDAVLDCVTRKNSADTLTSAADALVASTWYTVEFYYDGGEDIEFHVNGIRVAGQKFNSTNANVPDDEDLTVTMFFRNGEAVAKTMNIDFIEVWGER